MDTRTGEVYASRDEARSAGVPDPGLAEIVREDDNIPVIRFASGPFKNRLYKRMPTGQLVRVKDR